MIPLNERIDLLDRLGVHLRRGEDELLQAYMHRSFHHNPWFTLENQEKAIGAIAEHFLRRELLEQWLEPYDRLEPEAPAVVGLVMAGNLPLVGFHDVLCVFAAGHRAQIKLSEKDQYLLPYLLRLLGDMDARTKEYFEIVSRLRDFDRVIATGSNNSARYFEAYFGKYPHIIRRNRNGVAVLTGRESTEELQALGRDVFDYFGLGCRNVAKIYVPGDYHFEPLMEQLHEYRQIVNHNKYKNNFDYNFAVRVLNKEDYMANGCIILSQNKAIASHIAGLYYEFYDDLTALEQELAAREHEIQCVVAQPGTMRRPTVPFGASQTPSLRDYADGVDTMAFLTGI